MSTSYPSQNMAARADEQLSIPIIDLSAFTSDNPLHSQRIPPALCKACQDLGFVYIKGYHLSSNLLQEAFSWSKRLFDLEHQDKMKAPHPSASIPHRGYSHPGLEKVYSKDELSDDHAQENKGASLRKIMDFKVSYDQRLRIRGTHQRRY